MASVVDICNSALNMLGGNTIISLTETSKNARLCNQRYELVRDAVFREHPWNCLQKRVELAQDTVAPSFEFSSAYTLPADYDQKILIFLITKDLELRVESY